MGEELKPCPFCGGEAEEWEVSTYSIDSSYDMFGCRSCGIGFDTGKDAENVKLWNTRTENDTDQARCAECTCERGGDDCDWIKSKPDTVTGWQDISTAPKDGTEILLWLRDCMTIAYWYEHDSCWLECSGEIWQEWQVTAWMLLPPAPEKKNEQ